MNGISVKITELNEIGSLTPAYDKEANIVVVESKIESEWTYGLDIDGLIIFDATKHYVLVNFDILMARKLWKVVDKDFTSMLSGKVINGNIQFTKEAIEQKSFSLPVEVFTNKNKSEIKIEIGRNISYSDVVKLSSKCYALINGNYLSGFYLIL